MPDLLVRNAHCWTGDPAAPWADTLFVRDGRFAFVGRDSELNVGDGVETIDARGRLVLPGFIDGHAHLLNTGAAMRSVDLKGVESVHKAARRVGERAAVTPVGGWITGAGWDQHLWPGAAFPTRHDLDSVAPAHPVALTHTSGHCVWLNSAALRACGIDAATAVPDGGAIDREASGEPSGVLRDAASDLLYASMPPPSQDERVASVRQALAHAAGLGITSVHAMDVGRGELAALKSLHDDGDLSLRVRPYLTASRLDEWCETQRTGDGDELLRIGGVKFFADGALGPLTAWMHEPYEGSGDLGLALVAPEELERQVRRCLEHGLAPAIHAIGDRANTETLNVIKHTRDISPALPRRIEHAQLLIEADIARFAALDVVASMQPIHATQDMTKIDRHWGGRGRRAYAFASLARRGATLALGSDSPVETMDPLAGVHAAVTRRNAAGEPPGGWNANECITLAAALAGYTTGCAAAAGAERLGRIATGWHADFVLLDNDIFALEDAMGILNARVDITVAAGVVIYDRSRS